MSKYRRDNTEFRNRMAELARKHDPVFRRAGYWLGANLVKLWMILTR